MDVGDGRTDRHDGEKDAYEDESGKCSCKLNCSNNRRLWLWVGRVVAVNVNTAFRDWVGWKGKGAKDDF